MARIPVESSTPTTVVVGGRELLAFGGCNYLGLAHHPDVLAALTAGLARYGISTTASRETTGNTTSHESLEAELAAFTGQEAAILSAEGYTANFMCLQGLAGRVGIALIDRQAHRSLRNAATSAGMQVFEYEHLEPSSAAWLCRQYGDSGVAILTDSVFAADGAVAPLPALLDALPPHRSALVVDDCHGFSVLGPGGRGGPSHFGLDDPRVCVTTTLAKGLGCYGGVVMGRRAFIDGVREHASVYRGSTPVPPAMAEACRAAVAILRREPERVEALRRNIAAMRRALGGLGLPLPPEGIPIFTFTLDPPGRMQAAHDTLLEAGILAPLIEYPGGPSPRYFRVVVNAMHSAADIERLAAELAPAVAAQTG